MITAAVIVGKFLPPHRGHHLVINTAHKHARDVHVLLCTRQTDVIPGDLRRAWLKEIHPSARIHVVPYDNVPGHDTAEWVSMTQRTLGYFPGLVVSSEGYGDAYARLMGARHLAVDMNREAFPVSGTRVRQDPFGCWDYLEPCVRAYFTIRVAIVGAESTGKTTLSQDLAAALETEWVPEVGREYTYRKLERYSSMDAIAWHSKDFAAIARMQQQQEDAAARRANRVLVCDTDSFATAIWHERYMGRRSPTVDQIARNSHIWLYFLPDIGTPFFQDGVRDGEAIREWMHARFREALKGTGRPYAAIDGDRARRLRVARDNIEFILAQPFNYGRANAFYRPLPPLPASRLVNPWAAAG